MTTLETVLLVLVIVLLVLLVAVGIGLIFVIRRLMWTIAKFSVIAEVVDQLAERVGKVFHKPGKA